MTDLTDISDYRKRNSDITYFNAYFRNRTNVPQQINYLQTRAQNIVDKANDYYLSVLRFDVPNTNLPFFYFQDNIYSVTITTAGTDKQIFLNYISVGEPGGNLNPGARGVYYHQQFLDMLNLALETEWNQAPAAAGDPPVMVLNDDSKFELRVDVASDSEIWFSRELYRFFLGIESIFGGYNQPNGKDQQILYKDNNNNTFAGPPGASYWGMEQETSTLYNWYDIRVIAIISNSMPCKQEYIGIISNNLTNEIQIIADYVPPYMIEPNISKSEWIFHSINNRRIVDLISDNPLRTIDFRVIGLDRHGEIFPIFIAPGDSASVKFEFIKKSLYNNEYSGDFHVSKIRQQSGYLPK